jgi:serine/threonine-protein kinase HipA
MAKNEVITLRCFGQEIGRIGYDENKSRSSFQYNPEFLQSNHYSNIIPQTGILKKESRVQLFTQFNSETFRGLPPMIADSLPDVFGNIIFKKWLESKDKNFEKISVLEQLAYVANRGIGAFEFEPSVPLSATDSLDLSEVVSVLGQVLHSKESLEESQLNSNALLNIFKIGTSAGGARPKILISENKETGVIIPGDLNYSAEYEHYLVKLQLENDSAYSRELIEYSYYHAATNLGITMMPSKLIDQQHFATLRFDRVDGKKKHVLTATGLTGWDFQQPKDSHYENLFELALFLKIPNSEIEELFKRMVFNIVFCNTDDHLKNHSFCYNEIEDKWNLSPAYDLTYSLNPLLNYKRYSRALGVNGKRVDVLFEDVLQIAQKFTIKNPKSIILTVQQGLDFWEQKAIELNIPRVIIQSIQKDFVRLI